MHKIHPKSMEHTEIQKQQQPHSFWLRPSASQIEVFERDTAFIYACIVYSGVLRGCLSVESVHV